MTEINSLGAPAAVSLQAGKAAMTGELLRLLQPQPGLLAAGENARAEVVSLRQAGQDFQLLLRLTLAGGLQNQVRVSASQPLPVGTLLVVSQPAGNPQGLAIRQVTVEGGEPLVRLDTARMPVGTLLQAKVVTSQAQPQAPGQPVSYRALATLVNTAQAGATLSIDSPRPLNVGSLLSALVESDQALRFVPLAGRQDQLATEQQLRVQQGRQASLPGLLEALQQLSVDDELGAGAQRLLASLPDLRQLADAKGLAQAFASSGAFLEAGLLGGPTGGLERDVKAQLLRLVAQLPPGVPGSPTLAPANASSIMAQALPGMVRNALGLLGQVGPRPQPGAFPLPSRLLQSLEQEDDLEHLLRLAAAAIARLQSHQLASLQQTGMLENGNLQTTWQTEITLRQGLEFVPLQVKLQREEPAPRQDEPPREQREPLRSLWRIELAFDVVPLGPLQIQAQLDQGKLSGQLWAQRPATAALVDRHLDELRTRLLDRGLQVGDLACHAGAPPQGTRTRLEQRWVDDTA